MLAATGLLAELALDRLPLDTLRRAARAGWRAIARAN